MELGYTEVWAEVRLFYFNFKQSITNCELLIKGSSIFFGINCVLFHDLKIFPLQLYHNVVAHIAEYAT